MMYPLLFKIYQSRDSHGIAMERFLKYVGITKQAFHKARKAFEANTLKWESLPDEIANYRASTDYRAGSRSLFYNLNIKHTYGVGINKFERKVAELGLSLAPLRTRIVTTRSCKQSWNYHNEILGLSLTRINQVVVGDLTYLFVHGVRYFLFVITDIYSGRIVGWSLSIDMRASSALAALNMLIKLRGKDNLIGCYHHTDGGSQYFSTIYLDKITECEMIISRADNCLENGYAEQRNGYIKNHLLPLIEVNDEASVRRKLGKLIDNYNNLRKQQNLGWKSPVEFEQMLAHGGTGSIITLCNFEEH